MFLCQTVQPNQRRLLLLRARCSGMNPMNPMLSTLFFHPFYPLPPRCVTRRHEDPLRNFFFSFPPSFSIWTSYHPGQSVVTREKKDRKRTISRNSVGEREIPFFNRSIFAVIHQSGETIAIDRQTNRRTGVVLGQTISFFHRSTRGP